MDDARSWLDDLAIETPCSEPWEGMTGDDRVRHCAACRLDVHDLSAMTRTEAEALVRTADGRLCARIHRRPDGRVLTRDCGPARRGVQRRRTRVRVLLTGLLALLGVTGCRQSDEGTVTVGVVMPESYEQEHTGEPAPDELPAPSPVPPRAAEGPASCG